MIKMRYQCRKCEKIGAAKLPCRHECCKKCLIDSMEKKSINKKLYDFECPECNAVVYFEFLQTFYMDDEELSDIYDTLNICVFCKLDSSYLIRLDCKHRACIKCLYNFIQNLIDQKRDFTYVNCRKCNIFISPMIYQSFQSKETLQNFIDIQAINNIKTICIQCKNEAYSDRNALVKCKKCIMSFCIICRRKRDYYNNCISLKNISNATADPLGISSNRASNMNCLIPKIQNPLENEKIQSFLTKKCCKCNHMLGENHNCSEYYCDNCFRSYITEKIRKDPFSAVKCQCGSTFPEKDIIKGFGSRSIYENQKKKAVDSIINSVYFTCNICLEKCNVEGSITLDCDHRYCHGCINKYLTEQIMSSNVSDKQIICPECALSIDHNIIKGVVSEELFEKYTNFTLRNWKPEEGLILKICYFCKNGIEIDPNLKVFRCPACENVYCPQCNNKHDEEMACQEYRLSYTTMNLSRISQGKKYQSREIEEQKRKEEALALDYIKNNFKVCPQCKNAIGKDSGCNFIKCTYPGCENSYFCFLCERILTVYVI